MTRRHRLQHQLQPAATVLERLGVNALARTLGLTTAVVSNWNRPPQKSGRAGTGGYIPLKYWARIAEIAKDAGYDEITIDFLSSKPFPDPKIAKPIPRRFLVSTKWL